MSADESSGVVAVDIDALEPNPLQPRTSWDDDDLEELAASIREHGVIQPLIVTTASGTVPYQIIAGERRWRAARVAGLSSIPVLVREVTTAEALELALVENVQRADLNAIEEAIAYRHLNDEFGLTQEQIAQRVGKSRAAIANTIRLLDAPKAIQQSVVAGVITAGHARALLSLPDSTAQLEILRQIIDRGLNVRQTEQLVKGMRSGKAAPPKAPKLSPDERAIQDRLQTTFGTKVDLQRGRRGGKIVIHFYSDEELNTILGHIEEPE
jgi:ParB family transcriptional regulator, chromosome partitioning protein